MRIKNQIAIVIGAFTDLGIGTQVAVALNDCRFVCVSMNGSQC